MSRRGSNEAFFILGVLAGAAAALLIVPTTRRALLEGVRTALDEVRAGSSLDNESITQEAGAIEGGLAATRRWSESYSG